MLFVFSIRDLEILRGWMAAFAKKAWGFINVPCVHIRLLPFVEYPVFGPTFQLEVRNEAWKAPFCRVWLDSVTDCQGRKRREVSSPVEISPTSKSPLTPRLYGQKTEPWAILTSDFRNEGIPRLRVNTIIMQEYVPGLSERTLGEMFIGEAVPLDQQEELILTYRVAFYSAENDEASHLIDSVVLCLVKPDPPSPAKYRMTVLGKGTWDYCERKRIGYLRRKTPEKLSVDT
jgi:hypothetical protein